MNGESGDSSTSRFESLVAAVTEHSRVAIVLLILLTAAVGAGAPAVDRSSSLDQFQTDSTANEKLSQIQSNFLTARGNTTTAQVIVRTDNGSVLQRETLLGLLDYERAIRSNETINGSLPAENPVVGLPDVIATAGATRERARALRQKARLLRDRRGALRANRSRLNAAATTLNETRATLRQRAQDRKSVV